MVSKSWKRRVLRRAKRNWKLPATRERLERVANLGKKVNLVPTAVKGGGGKK